MRTSPTSPGDLQQSSGLSANPNHAQPLDAPSPEILALADPTTATSEPPKGVTQWLLGYVPIFRGRAETPTTGGAAALKFSEPSPKQLTGVVSGFTTTSTPHTVWSLGQPADGNGVVLEGFALQRGLPSYLSLNVPLQSADSQPFLLAGTGGYLALAQGGVVYLAQVDAVDGMVSLQPISFPANVQAMAWTPKGSSLDVATQDGGVWRFERESLSWSPHPAWHFDTFVGQAPAPCVGLGHVDGGDGLVVAQPHTIFCLAETEVASMWSAPCGHRIVRLSCGSRRRQWAWLTRSERQDVVHIQDESGVIQLPVAGRVHDIAVHPHRSVVAIAYDDHVRVHDWRRGGQNRLDITGVSELCFHQRACALLARCGSVVCAWPYAK